MYIPQVKPTAESIPTQKESNKELNRIQTKVNEFPAYMVSHVIPYLKGEVHSFRIGQLSLFRHKWERLTTDENILQTISRRFISNPPTQVSYPPNSIPHNHASLVDREIKSLIDKGVIVLCYHEPGEFISIFTGPKKGWKYASYCKLKAFKRIYRELAF